MATKLMPARKRKSKRRSQDGGRGKSLRLRPEEIDYKNVPLLQRLTSMQGKLFSRKRTALDAMSQRRIALALKRARFIALMPFVS